MRSNLYKPRIFKFIIMAKENSKEAKEHKDNSSKNDSNENKPEGTGIPGMETSGKYTIGNQPPVDNSNQIKKELEKAKDKLEKLKGFIIKKYSYIQAIGILPPQAIPFFIEEEEVPKETEKHTHLFIIIPEEKIKETPKIKKDLIEYIEKTKEKIWIQIKTPVDIWESCLDSKFDIAAGISMAFPIHDKGILGALRVAQIHKNLVLRKFDKYVVSYVIAGSLVRGEAVKTSDIDVFLVINDTDVKKMPRLELKERLRSMIYQYVGEAESLAGVKNQLSPQVYLLTEFWEAVKDAHPVMFTFIRDGIPLYDKGTFMPWKALLKMGKLKPSPESIDMFMSMGDKTSVRVKRTLLDLVVGDIFWSVITPSQALLMLYGLPPPNVKETVREMKNIFYDKEKMLEKKYIDILEKIAIKYFKGYEHKKIKEVSGKEVDELLKDVEDYLKRLKELREQIEKKSQERTIEQIYEDVTNLLQALFGRKTINILVKSFETELIKTGKFPQQSLRTLKDVISARADFKKGKLDSHKVDQARRNASILINGLVEYNQRKDLIELNKKRITINYYDRHDKNQKLIAELFVAGGRFFLMLDQGNIIKKITDKIQDSNSQEMQKSVDNQKQAKHSEINPRIFELIKKELGDYEIVL